jgi:intraflagellar transport protein 88
VQSSLQADDDLLEAFTQKKQKEIDASYTDPMGELPPRPKTAAKRREDDDTFEGDELGDDMLPE